MTGKEKVVADSTRNHSSNSGENKAEDEAMSHIKKKLRSQDRMAVPTVMLIVQQLAIQKKQMHRKYIRLREQCHRWNRKAWK